MLYFNGEEVQKCSLQIGFLLILIKQAILSEYFMYVGTVDDCNIYYNTQTVVKGWYVLMLAMVKNNITIILS